MSLSTFGPLLAAVISTLSPPTPSVPARAGAKARTFTLKKARRLARRKNLSLKAQRTSVSSAKKSRKLFYSLLGPHVSGGVDLMFMGGDSTFNLSTSGGSGFTPDAVDRLCGSSSDYADCLNWMAQNGEYTSLLMGEMMSGMGKLGDIMNSDYAKLNLSLYWEPLNVTNILNTRVGEVGVKMAKTSLRNAALSVDTQVTLSFYSVLAAQEALEIAKANAASTKAHLAQARALLAAGNGTRLDVLRWRAKVSSDEQQLLQTKVNIRAAKIKLNNLLGRKLDAPLHLVPPKAITAQSPPPPKSIQEPAGNHPQLQLSRLHLETKRIEKKKAHAAFLPTLSVSAGYSWQKYLPHEDLSGSAGWLGSWSVMVGVKIPIFDSMSKFYDAQRREREIRKAALEKRNTERRIRQSVRTADLDVLTAYKKIRSAKAQVTLASEAHESAKNQYSAGAAKTTDVLEAQNSLLQARYNLLNARFSYLMALARRRQAIGLTPRR